MPRKAELYLVHTTLIQAYYYQGEWLSRNRVLQIRPAQACRNLPRRLRRMG
jgi:hypothetical protein